MPVMRASKCVWVGVQDRTACTATPPAAARPGLRERRNTAKSKTHKSHVSYIPVHHTAHERGVCVHAGWWMVVSLHDANYRMRAHGMVDRHRMVGHYRMPTK